MAWKVILQSVKSMTHLERIGDMPDLNDLTIMLPRMCAIQCIPCDGGAVSLSAENMSGGCVSVAMYIEDVILLRDWLTLFIANNKGDLK